MLQQITISSKNSVLLKPLLETAMRNERKLLSHSIGRTRQRLAEFESQHQMSSADFDHRFRNQEIEETLDFIDWQMELKALSLLKEEYQALSEAEID